VNQTFALQSYIYKDAVVLDALVMEEEAPMSTTMAAAFGKLDTFKKPSRKKRRAPKKRKRNRTMDRLVSRTLQVGQQE